MTTPRSKITFYDNATNKIKVTSHFIQFKGTQFLIRNIAVIDQKKEDPNRNYPIFSLGAGLALILGAIADEGQLEQRRDLLALGITLVLTAVAWLGVLKTKHTLTLTTNNQREIAYSSEDLDDITQIKTAVLQAMDCWFEVENGDRKDDKKGDDKDSHGNGRNGKVDPVDAQDAARVRAA